MLLLSAQDMKKVFTTRDAIEADKLAFQMMTEGKVDVPLRTAIHAKNDGTFLFMPAYAPKLDAAAVKLVNVFPHNADNGLMTTPAQVLLIDGKTGYVSAILDGTWLTQVRTGAATGAAFDILAKKDCRKGALIGTGGQAREQLASMLEARGLEEVRVYSLHEDRCKAFCEHMQKEFASNNTKILMAASSDECIEDADLIVTATTSSVPVFDGKKVKDGATVSCVGTYEPNKHELDPKLLPRASKIICDWKEAVLAESGDLLLPIADGIICESDISGSLGDVITGAIPGRENDDEIIVFESVGIAAQDLMTAQAVYEKAKVAGVGTKLDL